jgi:hypothetical protein
MAAVLAGASAQAQLNLRNCRPFGLPGVELWTELDTAECVHIERSAGRGRDPIGSS